MNSKRSLYHLSIKENTKGSAIVETMVSIAILTVVMVTLLVSLINFTRINEKSYETDIANQLIRTLIEKYNTKQTPIPSNSTLLSQILKPEDIDKKFGEKYFEKINGTIGIMVFKNDLTNAQLEAKNAVLPSSVDKLIWIKVCAYKKPKGSVSSPSQLKLISEITTILDN